MWVFASCLVSYTTAHSADVDDVTSLLWSFTWTVAPIGELVSPDVVPTIETFTPSDDISHSATVIASQLTGYMALNRDQLCSQYKTLCGKITFKGFYDADIQRTYGYGKIIMQTILQMDSYLKSSQKVQDVLENITVSNGSDKKRGYATATRIRINLWYIKNEDEFRNIIAHELGHIVDLAAVQGKSTTTDASFTEFGVAKFSTDDPSLLYYKLSRKSEKEKNSDAKPEDFCSWYGMTNPFEDFAECVNLYVYHKAFFSYMAQRNPIIKQKYQYVDTILGWYSENNNLPLVRRIRTFSLFDRRPWDTTRITL